MILIVLGAVAIGLVLGLLGSGGSILTVPILVYLANQPDKVAIAESLAIVSGIALVGALPYARRRLVDWHSVVYFGVPAIGGTWIGAALSQWVPGTVQLILFSVVMIAAAILMFRGRKGLVEQGNERRARQPMALIVSEGLAVGVLTGLVGVGGGFLIVPALVLVGGLPMRLAVGTSLLIIAAKSAAGFWKYTDVLAGMGARVDWDLIALFTGVGIVGSLVGGALSQRVPQAQLKRVFAVFLVVMGTVILAREGPKAVAGETPAAMAQEGSERSGQRLPAPRPPSSALARLVARPMAVTPPTSIASTTQTQQTPMSFLSVLADLFSNPTRLSAADFLGQRQPGEMVIDVRTPGEFGQGHLAGALNLDINSGDFEREIQKLAARGAIAMDRPVYLYCRSGNRSGRATRILRGLGYEQAFNVGGFRGLASAGAAVSN